MAVNGDAIYGTRPWKKYGEGPSFNNKKRRNSDFSRYEPGDIRFTTKGDILNVFIMGWPGDNARVTIASLPKADRKIKEVKLLGYNGKLKWKQAKNGLVVHFPKEKPCEIAFTLQVKM